MKSFVCLPVSLLSLPSNAIKTYLALGQYADAGGVCYPSIPTLAKDTGLCERSVQRNIKALIDAGEIEREWQHPNGVQTTSRYRLHRVTPQSPLGDTTVTQKEDLLSEDLRSSSGDTTVTPRAISDTPRFDNVSNLPLVARRMLRTITPQQAEHWQGAWETAQGLTTDEVFYSPEVHLTQYLIDCRDTGHSPSPSRWLRFFVADRGKHVATLARDAEREERVEEDPWVREHRGHNNLMVRDWAAEAAVHRAEGFLA